MPDVHSAAICLIAAVVAATPGKPRTEKADDAMVLAFFEVVLAPQKELTAGDRAGCLAIGDESGHHDPEEHIVKALRGRYPWVQRASRCDAKARVVSVGPFWRESGRFFGLAGVEDVVGRCTYEATLVRPGIWRVVGEPCVLE